MFRASMLVGCLVFALPGLAEEMLQIAPVPGSDFSLDVAKTGLMAGKVHHFVFTQYHGTIVEDSTGGSNSKISLTVQSRSVTCKDTWVSEKDREKILKYTLTDMLDAEHYPEIRYVSSAVEVDGKGRYTVRGMLTIRDRTQPVTVMVDRQMNKSQKIWWVGSADFFLSVFNLKRPTAALGAIGTKDEVHLAFRLSAAHS